MNNRYQLIGKREDKVIEECSEVIQAIVKIKNFGLFNYHPARPESSNRIEVLGEIADLRLALNQYEDELLKAQP